MAKQKIKEDRKKDPVSGSASVPHLSEQDEEMGGETNQKTESPEEVRDENVVLDTPGGEMPDVGSEDQTAKKPKAA